MTPTVSEATETSRKLAIGYLMQADAVDMSTASGPQQHVEAIVRGLQKRGHDLRMVAIQRGEARWTDDLSAWRPCPPTGLDAGWARVVESVIRGVQARCHVPFLRLFDSIRFSSSCVQALRHCDILYERDGTMCYGGILAARRLGIPIVLELNGDLVEEWRQLGVKWSPAQRWVVHAITAQIYRRASHLIAVGENLKQRLMKRWSLRSSHLSVVKNGADTALFSRYAAATDVHSLREPKAPVVLFAGSFQPWHGVDLILSAFVRLRRRVQRARMVFVGDGPLLPALQREANGSGVVEDVAFTGRASHDEVARLLGTADVAVIYHRAAAAEIVETPLKLFEYMAAGKAIVAPAVPNMMRVLEDRKTALLVPPDDPEALSRALEELLRDAALRASLGMAAQREAIDNYSWERAAAEVEGVLQTVLGQHRQQGDTARSRARVRVTT